jgi:hypothetical protein
MINLRNLTNNDDIIIYVNTLSADIPYDSDLFLFGFKNGFTNTWTYVMPQIVTQNSRYIRFSIQLVNQADFGEYRKQLRALAVNPVSDPVWPVKPEAIWSS